MPELYPFQNQAVKELRHPGKHIVVAQTGCLAKGTPIRMADGSIKVVEDVQPGDSLLAYNEDSKTLMPNKVASVFRACNNPKPMIELEYDGERITTTYDHYFYTGYGFAPLYQLIWGALETSQRLQLQLLCQQYGQDCDDKLFWWKWSGSNEPRKGQTWLLSNSNEWQNSQSPSSYCRDLVEEPIEFACSKPFRLRPQQQQSGESRVVQPKVQCLVWREIWEHSSSDFRKQQTYVEWDRTNGNPTVLSGQHSVTKRQSTEATSLSDSLQDVSSCDISTNPKVRNWTIKIKVPEPYYTISMCQAPYSYCIGRKHNYITHNSGKSAVALSWAKTTNKTKWLVVTTASARDSKQWFRELEVWCKESLSSISLEVVSWNGLAKWVVSHWQDLEDYCFILDEVAKMKAGVSSARGKAALQIAKRTDCWAGFTATPGDRWIDFQAYFVAGGYVQNKTQFMREFCEVQTYKGYPEIVGYRDEHLLRRWWQELTVRPDTRQMERELPSERHRTYRFPVDTAYRELARTHTLPDGTFLDTSAAYCAALRRACFTTKKQQWLADYLEGVGQPAVLFYALTETGDRICQLAEKVLPKGAKVWRICGGTHDIPTAETIGKYDVVVCQWEAGSEALNLQFIQEWVSVQPCYSYSTSQQARGRIRRIGQQKPMRFTYLSCAEGIEGDIYSALKTKSDFSEQEWGLNNKLRKE